ncbi:hypothetical protein M5F04_04395 [Acinetobacter sp. ANC 7200]|uniref:hypothetical protein n=1 Tax=Acinetobacter amyesii TaxID=2942470 RepID=UPI0020C0BC6B|nr:hypothetical protein [Acinetobacter amyesii]MCL6243812.1 hypothetical protein [Acinetobacter amyesii]
MYIWIETIEATVESSKAAKKDITIEIKNYGAEYQVLFTFKDLTPLSIPNLDFGDGFRVGNAEGCVMCPCDAELSTKVIVDVLEHLKQTGLVIHSINSDDPKHNMVDFKKIQNCISEL